MDYLEEFNKSPLITIPEKKLDVVIRRVIDSFPDDKGKSIADGLSDECSLIIDAIHRYASANIPVDYWFLNMDEFKGDKSLLNAYKQITNDIEDSYYKGTKLCFAGNYGVGKTYTCACILKHAVEKGHSALYTTLTDIVSLMVAPQAEGKYEARKTLLDIDFLCIDEWDPRYMQTESASDLYARMLEPTLRTRIHNRLPLLLCTNSPNVLSSFSGALKQSISSLMNMVKIIPVLGGDYRSVVGKVNE